MSLKFDARLYLTGSKGDISKLYNFMSSYRERVGLERYNQKGINSLYDVFNEIRDTNNYKIFINGFWIGQSDNELVIGIEAISNFSTDTFRPLLRKWKVKGFLVYSQFGGDSSFESDSSNVIKIDIDKVNKYIDIMKTGDMGETVYIRKNINSKINQRNKGISQNNKSVNQLGSIKIAGLVSFRIDIFYSKYLIAYKLLNNANSFDLYYTMDTIRNHIREAAITARNIINNIYYGNNNSSLDGDKIAWANSVGINTEFINGIDLQLHSGQISIARAREMMGMLYDFAKSLEIYAIIDLGDPRNWSMSSNAVRGNTLVAEILRVDRNKQ